MLNIFIAYSGKDKSILEIIITNLRLVPNKHHLWHYQQLDQMRLTKKQILEKLNEVDLFTLIITNNSLDSPNVQEELVEAMRLTENGKIKLICPIVLDCTINPYLDIRIPEFIRMNIYNAENPNQAAEIIEKVIYNMF